MMEHMPRLPNITYLALCVMAYGHSFGASSFDVLRRCTSAKKLDLYFLPEKELEVILLLIWLSNILVVREVM
jgi:hypothetical protein